MRLLTKNEKLYFEKSMIECDMNDDTEEAHGDADDILCEALRRMGYRKIVHIFECLKIWYS